MIIAHWDIINLKIKIFVTNVYKVAKSVQVPQNVQNAKMDMFIKNTYANKIVLITIIMIKIWINV